MKEYQFKINGKDFAVSVEKTSGKKLCVHVNGKEYDVELNEDKFDMPTVRPENEKSSSTVTASRDTSAQAPQSGNSSRTIFSPLPGVILKLLVKEGQTVRKGETVAILEAMKMENDITSSFDGVVKSVKVNKGDSVLEGAVIATLN